MCLYAGAGRAREWARPGALGKGRSGKGAIGLDAVHPSDVVSGDDADARHHTATDGCNFGCRNIR